MQTENKYVQSLPGGAIIVNIHALREDGIELTVEEAAFLGGLDIPEDMDTIALPDGTGLGLSGPVLAIIEFVGGWYVAAEWLKIQVEADNLELAKSAFAKFYPELMKRYPALLDSQPKFKR